MARSWRGFEICKQLASSFASYRKAEGGTSGPTDWTSSDNVSEGETLKVAIARGQHFELGGPRVGPSALAAFRDLVCLYLTVQNQPASPTSSVQVAGWSSDLAGSEVRARCGGPRGALASADAHILLLWQVLDGASLVPKDPPKVKRRVRIPDKPNYSLNLWSIMKNCIGRELSKIPMPVGVRAGHPHWVPWGCLLMCG